MTSQDTNGQATNRTADFADLTLDYYDRAYLHGLSQRNPETVRKIDVVEDNPAATAQALVAWADGLPPSTEVNGD